MTIIKITIYLAILLLGMLIGIFTWKKQDPPIKILIFLLTCTFFTELAALLYAYQNKNNNKIYHLFGPLSLGIIAWYYQKSIPIFKKYKIAIILVVLGIIATILNLIFFQKWNEFNSNFILFNGLCVVALALISFIYLAKNSEIPLRQQHLLWVSLIFLVFWASTYLCFALFHVFLIQEMNTVIKAIYGALWISNLLQYSCIAVVIYYSAIKLEENG